MTIFPYFFTFLYVYVRKSVCVQKHGGGWGYVCTHVQVHTEVRGQVQVWFLGCYPLILCVYRSWGWGIPIGLKLTK